MTRPDPSRPCQCGRECGKVLTKKGQKYAPECKQYANNALHAYRKLHPSTDTRRKRTAAPGRVQQTWILDGVTHTNFADFAAAMKAPGRKQCR